PSLTGPVAPGRSGSALETEEAQELMMLLEGKVALVAGVGPGLGAESALALAREGANLVLAARRPSLLEEIAAEIESMGRRVVRQPTDITDREACERLVAKACDVFGSIDVLMNNAFYQGEIGSVMETDLDDWRRVLDVNLLGALNMTRAVVPAMGEDGGSIIMVNSLQAWTVVPGFGSYSASKGALENLTRTLAAELGPRGIRVNGIFPGLIMGEAAKLFLQQQADQRGTSYEQIHDEFASQAALRFIPDARDMAGTVLYLASELARPITGQSIGINAGAWFH
ncbi:MAG: SDR family oxidoreductase, partial [Gemmatimonadetes bacterium]|nr:SDR family oxidoreductase [Gemmatimonadota bacterium]